ncbi:general odorant-binding protein 56d-like [Ochlerotatus camptorhynchus]|uniref:general odorant-binding protein 56d-like n=1 Tax=Ochlerotatus camptorhynchus TaxID=644619 RepID=UPI0031D9264D
MQSSGAVACCLLIAIVAVNAWPMQKKVEIRKHIRSCVKETGVPGKNALRVLKGNFVDESYEVKCFVKCMFNRVGFINDDNELMKDLLIEKIRQNLEEEEADQLIEKCNMTNDDINELAFAMYRCCFENIEVPTDILTK